MGETKGKYGDGEGTMTYADGRSRTGVCDNGDLWCDTTTDPQCEAAQERDRQALHDSYEAEKELMRSTREKVCAEAEPFSMRWNYYRCD